MKGTVDKDGSTYQSKMKELEEKISGIEDTLSKLQAQKRIAQTRAHSGEFLHHNIRFCLDHLDKIPRDVLLKALIKNIEIYDDRIAMDMYVSEPIEGILPSMEFLEKAIKHESPTSYGEAVAPDGVVSPGGQKWGRWLHEVRNLMISLPTPFNPMYYQSA